MHSHAPSAFTLCLLGFLIAAGCESPPTPDDAGPLPDGAAPADAGPSEPDASPSDSGTSDSGGVDSGGVDSGGVDSGGVDSGGVDAGALDSGGFDACVPADETCNGVDDDCDGMADEGSSIELECAAAEVCDGTCTCPTEVCDAVCRDTMTDRDHCGGCGVECDTSCVDGGCATIAAVAPGGGHTCVLLSAGAGVWCWGDIGPGAPGSPSSSPRMGNVPYPVPNTAGATRLTSGSNHSCAIYDDERVRCWGRGRYGVLGDGSDANSWDPVEVMGLSSVDSIDSRADHTCATTTGGDVYCWGRNHRGQLGDGTMTDRSSAVLFDGSALAAFGEVRTGSGHTCGRTSDAVYCWGSGRFGALGDGDATDHTVTSPRQISGLGTPSRLAVGGAHACAIADGPTGVGLYCWGRNQFGQTGVPSSTAAVTTPTEIPVSIGVAIGGVRSLRLSATNIGSCFYSGRETPQCWGSNLHRERGDGTTSASDHTHRVVADGTGLIGLTGGGIHNCAYRVESGGERSVLCWGDNDQYQLGYGSFGTDENRPGLVLFR